MMTTCHNESGLTSKLQHRNNVKGSARQTQELCNLQRTRKHSNSQLLTRYLHARMSPKRSDAMRCEPDAAWAMKLAQRFPIQKVRGTFQ